MPRTRRDVWKLGSDWNDTILWYARAVKVMSARPFSDMTSWRYLAAMHGVAEQLWRSNGYMKPGEPPICVPTKLSSRNASSSETDRGSSVIGPPDCPVDPYRATTKSGLVPLSGHVCDQKAGGRSSRLGLLSSL